MKTITPLVIFLSLAATLTVQSAVYAQQLTIQPAADGTGTIVNPEGNTFNITGGTTSSSGANLFQSFTSFGLSSGQVANFLSAPNTQNILSRVTGGSFSLIDGLLKVTGSSANLFLLNPSGIVFGPNASLNVPAAFTATTANGIAFGSQWFNAFGPNNYAALNGSPGALGFTMSKPGAIINAGNLSVGPGQALSLISGTVASTGQLSGGQVTLAAVPGEHYVRLGQPGSPLSIEVPISGAQLPPNWDLPIYSLPELLTGTNAGLTVADDGTVQLTNSQLTVKNGDVVARKIDAESATLSANQNVTLPDSQLETTKDLLIQAKDTVTARDSKENPVLVKAGGNLTIQGDKSVDLLALNHPGQAFQSGGNLRLVSDGNVSGDAHFGSGGKFSIETLAGKPGKFVSLYDPIISSGNDVSFGDYTGVSLKVESGGNITGGNIKITGPDFSIPGDVVDADTLKTSSALILKAGVTLLDNPPSGNISVIGTGSDITIPSLNGIGAGGTTFKTPGGPSSTTPLGTITLGRLATLPFTVKGDTGTIKTNFGLISLDATGDITINGDVNAGRLMVNAGNATLTSGITLNGSATTNFNPISLDATGDITINGDVNAGLDDLTVNTPGITTFNKSVDANNLTTGGGGLTVLNGNVTTTRDQTYNDDVQLNNSLTLDSGGSISFGRTVNSNRATTNNLVVNTTNANVNFGQVGNSQPLGKLTVNTGEPINMSGVTLLPGTINLNDNVTTVGDQTYDDNVQLNSSLTLDSGGSSIFFGGAVNSKRATTNNLVVNTKGGDVNFGQVGNSQPLGKLTVNTTSGTTTFNNSVSANNLTTDAGGLTVLNGNVTTVGDQTYGDNVKLTNSLTLASTGKDSIFFGGMLNSQPYALNNLEVNTNGGNVTLNGIGGNVTTLIGNLTVNTSGTTTFNNSSALVALTTGGGGLTVLNGKVLTFGGQTYNDDVQLNSSLTLTSTGNGSIFFDKTVNSQPAATNSLVVDTKGGNASFNGPVGNTQPLSNLTVNAGNISLAGIGTTTQAGVTGNTNFQTPGSITFSGNTYNANTQIYSGGNIAVNGGNTIFTASSDPIAFQGPITLGNSGLTIVGASAIDTNSINGTGPINFTAAKNIKTGNIATNGGAIALTSGGIITAGTIDSSIRNTPSRGAPITLRHQGNSFIVNGTPANGSSSSGTITSRSNNVIPNGNFTGPFTGTYIQDDIAIIGPPVTPSIPPGQPGGNSGNVPIPPTGYPPGPNPTTKPQPPEDLGPRAPKIDLTLSKEPVKPFENYYGANFTQKQFSLPELQDNLERLEKATGKKLAIINVDTESKILTLITPKDNTVVAIPLTVTSEALRDKANLLRREIADPSNVTSSRYLTTSRQLYGWLIKPLEADLQAKKVDTLIFQLDSGLRLTPLAALNDGKQFLVEKYAISLIPSINLLDTSYDPERVRASKVLAMGASTFKDDVPLPAVPAELRNVTQEAGGSVFLNENFTLGNLKAKTASYGLIHLATHADFNRGPVQGSYIKLSDTRLGLNQMRDLGWSQQKIELLVLSACRTAFGDSNTELGFAGLAVGAGVKTAVATLWRSSDLGTFGLMSDFYDELKTAPIKADALRAAQVAMLRGEVRVENGQLRFKKATFPLPEDLKALGEVRLTHPYYWSGFTMIGSPW